MFTFLKREFHYKHLIMKQFIFAAIFILAPVAVNAGQIMPNLYAEKYCELRKLGLSRKDAIKMATEESYIMGEDAPKVTLNGELFSSDVVRASIETYKLCPKLMQ